MFAKLGMLFLALYLIMIGIVGIFGLSSSPPAALIEVVLALAAGVCILLSLRE